MKKFHIKKFTIIGAIALFMFTFCLDSLLASELTNDIKECPKGDMNEDCVIGMEEVISALQIISGYSKDLTNTKLSNLNKLAPSDISDINDQQNKNEIPIDTSKIVAAISEFMQFFENSHFKEEGLAGFVKEIVHNTDIPCGEAFIKSFYPFDAAFHFNGTDECMGISGTAQIKSNIFDTKAYLTFENIQLDQYSVNGDAVASVSPLNCGYKAILSSENLSICGQEFSGMLFAENNSQTNNELLVGMKGSGYFVFNANHVRIETDVTYSHKGGANGKIKGIINNEAITFDFHDFVIDLKRLMPVSGVMKMNDNAIDFGY
ncbi:conserved hypothetical protein, secreted [Candidatus Magnetomorum sp. HK-1]|nr:conserved hypothetical protein, secreted [Candidatus Magnetomorum sp. HK-1]